MEPSDHRLKNTTLKFIGKFRLDPRELEELEAREREIGYLMGRSAAESVNKSILGQYLKDIKHNVSNVSHVSHPT